MDRYIHFTSSVCGLPLASPFFPLSFPRDLKDKEKGELKIMEAHIRRSRAGGEVNVPVHPVGASNRDPYVRALQG